jgi:hypothetical protein
MTLEISMPMMEARLCGEYKFHLNLLMLLLLTAEAAPEGASSSSSSSSSSSYC